MMRAVENYYENWQRIQGIDDPDRIKADSWSAHHACRAAFKAAPKEYADESILAALERSSTALDDWLNTYAPDLCDAARVKEARQRIRDGHGTLAYIAGLQEQLRAAISKARGEA